MSQHWSYLCHNIGNSHVTTLGIPMSQHWVYPCHNIGYTHVTTLIIPMPLFTSMSQHRSYPCHNIAHTHVATLVIPMYKHCSFPDLNIFRPIQHQIPSVCSIKNLQILIPISGQKHNS